MKGLSENATALKEYNIKKFAAIVLAIKMKVHFELKFKKKWGFDYSMRQV